MRPMWCDDFDMDLLKVIPEATGIIAALDGITLKTHGGETFGTLNHPSMWNHCHGTMCFFGFDHPAKEPYFWTDAPIIECTPLELFRDLWAHGTIAYVEGMPIWNSEVLQAEFDIIMTHVRGWNAMNRGDSLNRVRLAQLRTIRSIRIAVQNLRDLAQIHKKLAGMAQ